jgi:hypothetical protein
MSILRVREIQPGAEKGFVGESFSGVELNLADVDWLTTNAVSQHCFRPC